MHEALQGYYCYKCMLCKGNYTDTDDGSKLFCPSCRSFFLDLQSKMNKLDKLLEGIKDD